MRNLKIVLAFLLVLSTAIFMFGCKPGADEGDNGTSSGSTPIAVTFSGLTADGSSTVGTTKLTLTFDKDITGLTASDITLTPDTIVTKGALNKVSGQTGKYDLAVLFIGTTGGSVSAAVAKSGYDISGAPAGVTVYAPTGTTTTGTWGQLTIPTATTAVLYPSTKGKSNVLHVTPGTGNGAWAVLSYSLADYAGKKITITVESEVWLENPGKVAWQVNTNSTYPMVAGRADNDENYTAGEWHTVSGSAEITIAANGGTFYLSTQQLGATNKAYITNFSLTIDDGSEPPTGVDMMTLTPLKSQFAEYFMIGNIFNPADANNATGINNTRLTRHYDILTPENNMKPSYLSTSATEVNTNNMNTAVRMIDAARASGMKVVAHTLLWHSQAANWQYELGGRKNNVWNADDAMEKNAAIAAMKTYITTVAGYTGIKGKVYSWDVLNEAFPDGVSASANWKTSMRTIGDSQNPNPWFVAIGSDFVYEGYKAARAADPTAILYYNDYNLNEVGKSTMVRDMVRDVNQQWESDGAYDGRKLIEGIGMQSHHNINVTAAQIKASLDLFTPLGVKISISELDVLSQSYGDYSPDRKPPTEAGKATAANLYGQYFTLFLEYSDIIERVTFWGVYDSQSWRASGLPLIFEGATTSRSKPAYDKIIESLTAWENK